MKSFLKFFLFISGLTSVILWHLPSSPADNSMELIKKRGYIIWGSDAEGGAPYVFPDPKEPSKLVGFEVEIAEAIARELDVKAGHSQHAWESLIPALERGDFDIAMNGIEITPQREERILFSLPYYIYTEQLVVRTDETRINGIDDLNGKSVGTLSGAVAHDILKKIGGVDIRIYSSGEPYRDLELGRIDAVFLDLPIAAYYAKPNPKLKYAGPTVGEGFYGIAIRREDRELKKAIDSILVRLLATGELKRIYEKWDMWNRAQERLLHDSKKPEGYVSLEEGKKVPLYTFFPELVKGAGITIFVSILSMMLAIILGLVLVLSRLFGRPFFSRLAVSYIEIYRGTPLLIQLYILYYGLPNIGISLTPLAAAVIGLGMNYAAYEAEIYRGGINAVPKGQTEAALSLGMTQSLVVGRIILPQAFKIALPGITNDFIALFKDSSIVSIIAMVELTKTYNILATTTLRFLELGLIVAFLYFVMSYPLSLLARRLEDILKGKKR